MIALAKDAPLHIHEARYTRWSRWFAWRPVKTEQCRSVWLRWTYRRKVYPPIWFVPPAPIVWNEFSDEQRGFWERLNKS
jgi:hypothetical protein